MKVSAALTLALAGVSIGSPVGLEERDLEPRLLALVPALTPDMAANLPIAIPAIPNLGVPAGPGLSPAAVSPANIVPAVTSILQSLLVVIVNLLAALPGNTLPIPTTFPGFPDIVPVSPTLPLGSLTPLQLLALTAALQNQMGNLTALGNNLPTNTILTGGLNAVQVTAVKDAITAAQAQLGPILSSPTGALTALGGPLAGGVPNLSQLQGLLTGFGPVLVIVTFVLSAVTTILGPLLGGGGLPIPIPGLGL